MFGSEFFPTPRSVARRMVAKVSDNAKYFLEPSAGKGDLADVVRRPITYEEFEAENPRRKAEREGGSSYDHYRWRDEDRKNITVDVIEPHPALSAVLRSKDYSVVGYDWLDYNGTSYYDAVIMNPPFSCGDKHLLKAWDFLHNGEIVCLLNEETIKNPYTEDRKRLARVIEAAGGVVEYLGPCFDTAERKTNVNVAMVYLKKVAPDDAADMWASEATAEKNYDVEVGEDPNMLALRDNLGNMEHWYNMANEHFAMGIEHLRKAKLYMDQNKIHDYQRSGSHEDDFKKIAGMALENAHTSRSEFLRRHRKLAWTSVFNQMEFNKWLDSKQQDRFMRDVERDSTIPFNADNIKQTLHNVFLSRNKLFDESVASIFDELCNHAVENASGPVMPSKIKSGWRNGEGWKTNDSYKVNERLIFPYGCSFDKIFDKFRMKYGEADQLYSDLDRILCVLDGEPFDKCGTIGGAINTAFDRKHFSQSTQVAESEYFEIRFFKKGTVHLKWKRLDLLERFNIKAASGKKWIGENTQQYRPTERKKKDYYCTTNGCQYDGDRVCTRCETPEVNPLDLIACEFCRAVTEATGETHCPMHPLFVPMVGMCAPLLLDSGITAI